MDNLSFFLNLTLFRETEDWLGAICFVLYEKSILYISISTDVCFLLFFYHIHFTVSEEQTYVLLGRRAIDRILHVFIPKRMSDNNNYLCGQL